MNLQNRKKTLRIFKIFSAFFIALLVNLYHTQINKNKDLASLAQRNFARQTPIQPLRGCIFDRVGVPLTLNRFTFRAVYMPGASHTTALSVVRECLPSDTITPKMLRKIQKKKFVAIKNFLSTEEIACIKKLDHERCGISIERNIIRHHPQGNIITRVLGQTGCPSVEDLVDSAIMERYLQHPLTLIGQSGCERIYDNLLAGKCGERTIKIDAIGNFIEEVAITQPLNGTHLRTTINAVLQSYVEELLRTVKAAHAVVLHIQTGQILAMVSHDNRTDDLETVASNKTISGTFPPGSIFKIITALSALQNNLGGFIVNCDGSFKLGRHTLHCWQKAGHGHTNLSQALYKSCNTFFYKLALQLGAQKIIKTAHDLGLTGKTHVDLTAEVSGIMPPHNAQTLIPRQPWYPADTAILGIGQGRIALTPLQIVHTLASILRGYITPPYINYDKPPSRATPLKVTLAQRKLLQSMLFECMSNPQSTGYVASKNLKLPAIMGGKTSTAQVSKITKVIAHKDLPWELRSHSVFVGFAPQTQPLIAIIVIGEHELWGSGFAAHTALKVCHYALKLHNQKKLLHTHPIPQNLHGLSSVEYERKTEKEKAAP